MMAHSHPQPRRLAESQKKTESTESSLSSPHKQETLLHSNPTTTDETVLHSKSPFLTHQNLNQNQTIPYFSNICSRTWSGLKLRCTSISSMASRGEVSVHLPSARRKKKLSGQQKREELEREVSMLHNLLDQEEKVHQVLKHAFNRSDGSTISIPSFLPPKMKELLIELAMVEDVIAQLEAEISHLQHCLSPEQEVPKELKAKQLQHGTLSNPPGQSPSQNLIPTNNHERLALETKSLQFRSKTMKGGYTLNNSSINENMGISRVTTDPKENHSHEEVGFEEKVSRKCGIQKPSSPKPSPRLLKSPPVEHEQEVFLDLPLKTLSDSSPSEDTGQKWQPNKLSESIMKCLIFIYVRLFRTSRSMDLEKSSTISKSIHSSLSSASFRGDISLNSKLSLSFQKDSRQQDPYGIFNVEGSIPRDVGPYKNFVRLTSSSLGLRSISSSSFIPLLQKLRVLMNSLRTVDLKFLTHQQKLAFWINMHNACTMHGFLQYGVPSSQEKLLTLMNKATLNIGGTKLNVLAIERFILRQPSSSNIKDGEKDEKEAIIRSTYGLDSLEPNVTFALCSGTRSSPAVRIYTAEGVSVELDKSKLEYLQASIVVTDTKRLVMPELLLQNMLDFGVDVESLVQWVCHQLPTSGSLRKSIVDCLRNNSGKVSDIVEEMPYELEFQYLLAI